MKRTLFLAALVAIQALITPASAQQFQLIGTWNCTMNTCSSQPQANFGFELDVQLNGDGSLFARGNMFNPQLMNSVQWMEGYGDWTVLPDDDNKGQLLKMRMKPQDRAIISWFARPKGARRMYELFQFTSPEGFPVSVETQCTKYN